MKAHKYWSIGAVITMAGTFYTGYKGLNTGHALPNRYRNLFPDLVFNVLGFRFLHRFS